jgi:glyoxylase-like metal-dependent hydrolase (beta-lactamase superfamily II)
MHPADALDGLQVWDRGWLSSTQTLVLPARGEAGALLFDSAHGLHAEQTVALLQRALGGTRLRAVVNTHLHSDHCGGNAAVQAAFGAELWIPPGEAAAVQAWDEAKLSHGATGQFLPRFAPDRVLSTGEALVAGGREWQLLAAPGHDPHALMAFDGRVLIAGDALWENGFGVVFGIWQGGGGFDDALAVLDAIEALNPAVLIPGHGGPCLEVPAALAQARRKLRGWRADPAAHARYAAKVLIKYHLMEQRWQALPDLLDWLAGVPLLAQMHMPKNSPQSLRNWGEGVVEELVRRGALRRDGELLHDV